MVTANQRLSVIMLLSLAAFAWRAFVYFELGSPMPACFFAGILVLLLMAWFFGQRVWRFMLYSWAFFLMLYGLLRLALAVLAQAGTIGSAHVTDATSIGFIVTSLIYIGAGVALRSALRRSRTQNDSSLPIR